MNIDEINFAPNFNGLNIRKVAKEHKRFIEKNFDELKELGEKYDISMKSYINNEFKCDGIDITVKNLRKNLGFFQKLLRPKGKSYFYTTPHYTEDTKNMTFMGQIKKAVIDLRKNSLLSVIHKKG